jgi:hypothetical protein
MIINTRDLISANIGPYLSLAISSSSSSVLSSPPILSLIEPLLGLQLLAIQQAHTTSSSLNKQTKSAAQIDALIKQRKRWILEDQICSCYIHIKK